MDFSSSNGNEVTLTIVLNAMGRLELADMGFRSWMLQKWDKPYEVVLSLFNDQEPRYQALSEGRNPNCRVVIRSYERPAFFNISAANNLGLHFAKGKYVLFANSDIIYPSGYAKRFVENMERHHFGYAVGSRYNLGERQTQSLRPAAKYTIEDNFDFLTRWTYVQWSRDGLVPIWVTCGPWMIRRDVALAIGGFDPAVLVSEDDDLASRAVHYMSRSGGEQNSIVSFTELLGYHLYHPTSELFAWHYEAHQIIDARRDRLRKDPASTEDTVNNRLDNLESLVDAVRRTPKPPPLKRYRRDPIRKVKKRVVAAARVLMGKRGDALDGN